MLKSDGAAVDEDDGADTFVFPKLNDMVRQIVLVWAIKSNRGR